MKSPREAYQEALRKINIKENEQIVLNSNDIYYIYMFARYIPGADINALQNKTLKSDNLYALYMFAHGIKEANVKLLEETILNSKRWAPDISINFCKDIKTANIKKHQEAIISTKDLCAYFLFARDVKKSNKQLLADLTLKSLDMYWIDKFYQEESIIFNRDRYDLLLMFL